jgi:hypothetical protein
MCYASDARNIDLIQSYIASCKAEASAISGELERGAK